MTIEKALQLKYGDSVSCPADRGNPAFVGRVVDRFTDKTINETPNGTKYIWVLVQTPFLHKSVWPSNRLG